MSETLWLVCAVVLIIEGIGPWLFPNRWRRYVKLLARQPVAVLRQWGALLVIMGLIILWLAM